MANGAFYIDCDRSFLIALFPICMAPLWDLFWDFFFFFFFLHSTLITFAPWHMKQSSHYAPGNTELCSPPPPKKKQSCPLVCILKYIYEAPSFYYLIWFFPPAITFQRWPAHQTLVDHCDGRHNWLSRQSHRLFESRPLFTFQFLFLFSSFGLRWHFYSNGNARTQEREREIHLLHERLHNKS